MRSYGQISVALGVAIKETGRTNPTAVTVFTDSKAGLKIQNEHLVDQREKKLRDYGPSLIIRWVLGHAKIEGNERADSAAKDVIQKERIETTGWGSFTHTKTELKIIQNSRTLYMAPASNPRERRIISVKTEKMATLGKTSKNYAARYCQLKIGHGAVLLG